jgi:hypothetical protein
MESPTNDSASQPKRPASAPRAPRLRSRVGNGQELIADLDKRSALYRQYADVVSDLEAHLGGDPTVVERAIAEEAAGLIVWCRQARKTLIEGGEFNVGAYTTATNALRRLLVDIGLEARLRDVTPTLNEYMAGRAREKEAAA